MWHCIALHYPLIAEPYHQRHAQKSSTFFIFTDTILSFRIPWHLWFWVGLKETSHQLTSELCLRIYVRKKISASQLHFKQIIPSRFDGIATDIIEKRVTSHTSSIVRSGCPIANSKGIPGTLGAFAYSMHEQAPVFITNYHVLFASGAKVQEKVWQLSNPYSQSNKLLGKTLYGKIGPVKMEGKEIFMDAAVGSIDALIEHDEMIKGLGHAYPGQRVYKKGSATGLTYGIVVDVHYPDNATMDGKHFNALNQILVRPVADPKVKFPLFSDRGDSGAVIYNENGEGLGMLWGTNTKGEGIASPLLPIFREFALDISGKYQTTITKTSSLKTSN